MSFGLTDRQTDQVKLSDIHSFYVSILVAKTKVAKNHIIFSIYSEAPL